MQGLDDELRNYFRRIGPQKQDNPEAIELAFQLQNSAPNDPVLLDQLVHLYTDDLYKWVGILLYYRNMTNPPHKTVLAVLKTIFETASRHVKQFYGLESISGWLFGIGYQCVKHYEDKTKILNVKKGINQEGQKDQFAPDLSTAYWDSLDSLPEKLRYTVILRYLFDLGIPEIASILDIREQDVHRRLVITRRHLLVNPIKSHLDRQIQSYVDGLSINRSGELSQLLQHLETCEQCQVVVKKYSALEKTLSESMKSRWAFSPLYSGEVNSLIQSLINDLGQPRKEWKVKLEFRKAGWILGFALAFIGMSAVLIRFTVFDGELQQASVTPTQESPSIVEVQPATAFFQGGYDLPTEPQYVEPAFSSDGKWAVFASIKSISSGRLLPTIELYNREANTIQVISEGTAPLDKSWIWWDLAPSISGDGRWIVYVIATKDSETAGDPCETLDQYACLDVFLFDRDTHSTRRLTQAAHGGPADGDSLAPSISENGQWVAFWSTADNLVDGFTSDCKIRETSVECLYIYLYDLDTGNIVWIPYPTFPGDPVFGVDRISLSADGRYVGFTISQSLIRAALSPEVLTGPDTQGVSTSGSVILTTVPDISHSSEAIVYDRDTGAYELENQAQDGTPGNGESSSPALSADGQYVAFTSASSNIVIGDTNNYSDVFLRDRKTGQVELISISSAGLQGMGDSGLSLWGRGYDSLNISSDGRYVIFASTATTLGIDLTSECNRVETSACNYLYLHDRQTGETEWLAALPNRDFTFFPEISSDGRWVSFMQSLHNCSASQSLCSNVMLYDRQHRWMSNLTRFGQKIPNLGWSYSSSLVIPWQTWESTAFAFSPDSKLMALGGADSKIRIWQVSNGNDTINLNEPGRILETGGNDYFSALTFSKGGEWLAAGTTGGTVFLWELVEGKFHSVINDQSGLVRKLAFSNDDTYLVISTLNGAWILWMNDSQFSMVDDVSIGITYINSIDISADGSMLALARSDGSVWLQSLPSGKVIGIMSGNQHIISDLAFSEDGSLLAVRASDGDLNIWQISAQDPDMHPFRLENKFRSHLYAGVLAISPDNNYLASAGLLDGIALWNLAQGKMFTVTAFDNPGKVYNLAFSKDGDKLAAVFENEIVIWGLRAGDSSSYFIQAKRNSFVDTKPLPEATATDIPVLQSPKIEVINGKLTLDQAAALSPFPLIIPSHLPENISFFSASANSDGSILLHYDAYNPDIYQASLYIYEKNIGNSDPLTMTIGADAHVIFTQIETLTGGVPAEYVRGDWYWRQGYTPPDGDSPSGEAHDIWDWDNTSFSQRLRWQQNGVLIAEYYQVFRLYTPVFNVPSSNEKLIYGGSILDRGDLEQIASWMVPIAEAGVGLITDRPNQTKTGLSPIYNVLGNVESGFRTCLVKVK